MSEWISVKDRLPSCDDDALADEFDSVLIYYHYICNYCGSGHGEKIAVGYYCSEVDGDGKSAWTLSEPLANDFLPGNSSELIKVTHWMPLPDRPEIK